MNFLIIVQARMGSSRLPRKMISLIGNELMIEVILKRLLKEFHKDEIILATSVSTPNEILVSEAKKLGVKSFIGSEENVLSRFVEIAKSSKAKYIVRITGDSPLVEANIIKEGLEQITKTNYDYISTTLDETFPIGIHVEIFRGELLKNLDMKNISDSSFEHVTPFIYNNKNIKKSLINTKHKYPEGRYTVDFKEDINFLSELVNVANIKLSDISPKMLRKISKEFPKIFKINSMIKKDRIIKNL